MMRSVSLYKFVAIDTFVAHLGIVTAMLDAHMK